MKHHKAGFRFRLSIADHIRVGKGPGGHKLLLSQCLYGVQSVPQAGSQFKFQILRSRKHLRADFVRNRLIVAHQQLSQLFHHLTVLCAALTLLAPTCTLVHVIVQTGTILANVFGELPFAIG